MYVSVPDVIYRQELFENLPLEIIQDTANDKNELLNILLCKTPDIKHTPLGITKLNFIHNNILKLD